MAEGKPKLRLEDIGDGVMAAIYWPGRVLKWWAQGTRRRLMFVTCLSLIVGAAVLTRVSGLDLRYEAAYSKAGKAVDSSYIPPHGVLKVMSLGHQEFGADMLFLQAHQYFTDKLGKDRIYHWFDNYADAILALDPDHRAAYIWAIQNVKFGQAITPEVLEKSNSYARRALERFPDDWRFYWEIGFNYFLEWPSRDPAVREEMRQRGMEYLTLAAALPDSQLDPNMLANFYLNRADVDRALFHAYLNYWDATPFQREQLRRRIGRYGSSGEAERLAALEESWKETYPFMPPTLFELVGTPPDLVVPADLADTSEERP